MKRFVGKTASGRVVSPTEGQSGIMKQYQSQRNENNMSSLLQFMTLFGTLTRKRLSFPILSLCMLTAGASSITAQAVEGMLGRQCSIRLCRRKLTVQVSVEQKSIGLNKSRTGSDVRYSCHHNSSRFTFPIFAHSCRFSVLHSLQSITPRIY